MNVTYQHPKLYNKSILYLLLAFIQIVVRSTFCFKCFPLNSQLFLISTQTVSASTRDHYELKTYLSRWKNLSASSSNISVTFRRRVVFNSSKSRGRIVFIHTKDNNNCHFARGLDNMCYLWWSNRNSFPFSWDRSCQIIMSSHRCSRCIAIKHKTT